MVRTCSISLAMRPVVEDKPCSSKYAAIVSASSSIPAAPAFSFP
jgi:hypothetical protein